MSLTRTGQALIHIAHNHAGYTVVSLVFGTAVAGDRASRFVQDMAGRAVNHNLGIDTIVFESYWRPGILPDHRAISAGAIAFRVYGENTVHNSDIIETVDNTPQRAKKRWCVLDLRVTQPDRIIPATIVVPYPDKVHRLNSVLDKTDNLPLWFRQSDGSLGVPIVASDFVSCPDIPTRVEGTRTSLKVAFWWCGYEHIEKQIQLRTEPSQGQLASNVPLRRLATLISGAVRNAMKTYASLGAGLTAWQDRRWRIGAGPGYISAQDVILLGIIWVSPGRVMPLLAVKPDFVFQDV